MEVTMHTDAEMLALLNIAEDGDTLLAHTHAPVIHFDAAEPFLPLAVGYTIFRENGQSPSFPRGIELPAGAAIGIEYAIWWDWDIEHLYELEHVWVYVDADGNLIAADASWHGGYNRMAVDNGKLTLYSEPGKHAFASSPAPLLERRPVTVAGCSSPRKTRGLLVTPLFRGIIPQGKPSEQQLVRTYLERQLFQPTYDFSKRFALADVPLVPWAHLQTWIPQRVRWLLDTLDATIPFHERRVLSIAHRGASAYAEENSAEAFTVAAHLGADWVEVDLRVTADSVPVISHDDSLKRVYGVDGLISELSYYEVKAKANVLTFAELLAQCAELDLGIYLDIKAIDRQAAQVVFEQVAAAHAQHRVIFASFRPDIVAELKAHSPSIWTSILFASPNIDAVALGRAVNADFVHPCWEGVSDNPHLLLTDEWLSAVCSAQLGIITWAEEREHVLAGLKGHGVIGICSDRPETVVRATAKPPNR
jgi:glycerophosphoryl diester phosphodiesterase